MEGTVQREVHHGIIAAAAAAADTTQSSPRGDVLDVVATREAMERSSSQRSTMPLFSAAVLTNDASPTLRLLSSLLLIPCTPVGPISFTWGKKQIENFSMNSFGNLKKLKSLQ